ncbi:hypothetical protein Tco_0835341 [Tanacetum coccineum]
MNPHTVPHSHRERGEDERICDFLHINNSEAHPLKEYIINFTMMNGKKPLTIGFKTFYESTGLDYNKGTYVSHPSPKDVKAKLARITTDEVLINRNPILKTAFPTAWRILFTFMIQVLGGNYSSTKQVNSIQQLIEYCLTTRTKVDIGEIIYSDLVTRLTNKSRQKYVSYPRFVLCALEVLLVIEYTQDENFKSLPNKEKKTKSHTVSKPKPKTQGPEASGILPQKRKPPKTQKTPVVQAIETPPTKKGSHYPPDEGTRKSQPLPEGKTTDPKDSKGNKHPADKELPFTVPDDCIGKTKPLPERSREDKDLERLKPLADMESLTSPVTVLLGTDAKYQTDHNTRLRRILTNLKEVEDAVKEDPALNNKVLEATEAYTKNSK